jgi:hypothetical protein
MFEFKHPKYYKELRKRNKSDQAISLRRSHDGERERAPDPGHKQQTSSNKQQAAEAQASSYKDSSSK